jgi:hypothetical protein
MSGSLEEVVRRTSQQPQVVITPEVYAQMMAPYAMPSSGAGVSQFLTGNLGIPMQFGVDLPAYNMPQFRPGDFSEFMQIQSQGTPENPVIPVYNPQTGGYDSPGGISSRGIFGGASGRDSNILGYTQSGAPIYSSPPTPGLGVGGSDGGGA